MLVVTSHNYILGPHMNERTLLNNVIFICHYLNVEFGWGKDMKGILPRQIVAYTHAHITSYGDLVIFRML